MVNDLLLRVNRKLVEAEDRWKRKQQEIGFADGPMESAGISLSRWILEDEIQLAGKEVGRLRQILNEVEKNVRWKKKHDKVEAGAWVKIKIGENYQEWLVTTNFEERDLGIVSLNLPMVAILAGEGKGAKIKFKGQEIEIVQVE
ncbi:MAG: hypothetical protein WC686_01225 [Candidatus Shapirobacteria bacterium]|jgi:hypothetical protein